VLRKIAAGRRRRAERVVAQQGMQEGRGEYGGRIGFRKSERLRFHISQNSRRLFLALRYIF